ncbi:polysaccharide deacetylase family protein [Gorillibacterium timonense]|uniref:polysaccharide deacetylase family protein n=1 Tax=Gorillibacterium timonense TaxID=1689269 RepID=UPI00071CA168|nr:polysaccharide deacetylase family protein [Gorillibacterium timonense]
MISMKPAILAVLLTLSGFGTPLPSRNRAEPVAVDPGMLVEASEQSGIEVPQKPHRPVQRVRSEELSLAELRAKYPRLFYLRGNPGKRQIALTFDDAPDPRFTPQILDILKAQDVKATFFIVGYRAERHPELVRRMIREGHAVGGHSYDHPDFSRLSDSRFRDQVLRTNAILTKLAGYTPNLVRPPYGEIKESQLIWLGQHGFYAINWSSDSLDWRNLKAGQVYANVMKSVGPGVIVLQHAGGGRGERLQGTIQALPQIIRELKARSYRLVTVPELLNLPDPSRNRD